MRRTIHADPRREVRRNRRQTRSVLPSNFQYSLEEKGQDVGVLRTSDGQRRQLVEKVEYTTIKEDLVSEKERSEELVSKTVELEEALIELTEIVMTLL